MEKIVERKKVSDPVPNKATLKAIKEAEKPDLLKAYKNCDELFDSLEK